MSKTIVCIDDNAQSRQIVVDVLTAAGYQVEAFTSAALFLTWFKSANADGIILDICMPDMSGSECLTELRSISHGKSIPVVAMTALALDEDMSELGKHDFSDIIVKPIIWHHSIGEKIF